LSALLTGDEQSLALPPVTELAAALTSLARGLRHKALLPLVDTAAEYALQRRGETVLVSCYGTESAPDVHLLNRAVPLEPLLGAAARPTIEAAEREPNPVTRQIAM